MYVGSSRLPPHVTSTEITRASVGLRSERRPILLAVMLSIGLVAIDATILATINEATRHIADEGTRRALESGVAASLKSMQAKAGEGVSMSLEAPRQG